MEQPQEATVGKEQQEQVEREQQEKVEEEQEQEEQEQEDEQEDEQEEETPIELIHVQDMALVCLRDVHHDPAQILLVKKSLLFQLDSYDPSPALDMFCEVPWNVMSKTVIDAPQQIVDVCNTLGLTLESVLPFGMYLCAEFEQWQGGFKEEEEEDGAEGAPLKKQRLDAASDL